MSELVTALIYSCIVSILHSGIIYLIIRTFFWVSPSVPSQVKFWVYYSALTVILILFIKTLFQKAGIQPELIVIADTNLIVNPFNFNSIVNIILQFRTSLTIIYLVGLLFNLIRLFKDVYYIYNISALSNLYPPPSLLLTQLGSLKKRLNIECKVSLFLSNRVTVPLTLGFFKPMILIPIALISHLSPQEVESIILHELAHIKRHDYVLNFFQRMIESILYFNPITWVISKEINKEREFSCDHIVVDSVDNSMYYATALLKIMEKNYQNSLTMSLLGNSKFILLNRIKKLNHMKNKQLLNRKSILIMGLAFIITISLGWILPQSDRNVPSSSINRFKTGTIISQVPETRITQNKKILKEDVTKTLGSVDTSKSDPKVSVAHVNAVNAVKAEQKMDEGINLQTVSIARVKSNTGGSIENKITNQSVKSKNAELKYDVAKMNSQKQPSHGELTIASPNSDERDTKTATESKISVGKFKGEQL